MSSPRRFSDDQLIRMNSLGLTLKATGQKLGVSAPAVLKRIQQLGLPRRKGAGNVMGDVWDMLTPEQREWLLSQLGPGIDARSFVHNLILKEYVARKG